jgi:hypothetical protein
VSALYFLAQARHFTGAGFVEEPDRMAGEKLNILLKGFEAGTIEGTRRCSCQKTVFQMKPK